MSGTKTYRGKDKDGYHVWRLRVWVADKTHSKGGRQVSETFRIEMKGSGTGEKASDEALAQFVARNRQNRGTKDNSTVKQLWIAWHDDLVRNNRLSPTTLYDYRKVMNNKIVPEMGPIRLRDLTSFELDAFYGREIARGVKPRTVIKYHRILSSMFRQAERWEWIHQSPTRNARAPKAERIEIDPPSLELVKKLVDKVPKDDKLIALIIALAPATGARRGELCGLRWSDVDFETGVLLIGRSAYEVVGGGVSVKSTKGGKPRRVSLHPAALLALRVAYTQRGEDLRALNSKLNPDSYIFSDTGELPWRPDRVTHAFEALRKKVKGAEGVRFHDLRHFHATHLAAMGMDFATISKRLGHAKISTTMDIYTKALDERDRDAADMIGAALTAPSLPS